MSNMNLGLDALSSVVERSKNIPPNQISCSLCYNISFDGKVCNNRKCQKVFCGECIKKQNKLFLDKNKKEFKCPFCQTFSGFSNLEQDIIDYIKTFKYYCNKNKNCKEEYSYEQMIKEHRHKRNNKNNNEKCYVCKKIITENNVNTVKCIICNNLCCFKNISYNAIKDNDTQKIKNLNNDFCIQRCFICKLPICKYCCKDNNFNKNNISNFICDDCKQIYKCDLCSKNMNAKNICIFCNNYLCESCSNKCESCGFFFCKKDCLSKKLSCENCINLNSKLNYYGCFHLDFLNCQNCFKKCYLCNKNKSDIKCRYCYNEICIKNCSIKCKYCSLIFCNKCSLICSICKKLTCPNCAEFCDECDKYNTLICCKNCHSNIIKNCQYQKNGFYVCSKRLCINCWNACNFCGTIVCSDHCTNCTNCEDIICDEHYKNCEKCLNKDELTYFKLCLKKCVLECSFCNNMSTVICKENNHINDLVHNFGCKHNICNSCIKKCENCGKIVKKCLECIDYYYELCRYCQKYQCLNCCNKCNNCYEAYCSLNHKCVFCNNIFQGKCYNCDIIQRNKCLVCKKKFKICELCKIKFICDFECYRKYKNKLNQVQSNEHLCQMFVCDEHLSEFDFSNK